MSCKSIMVALGEATADKAIIGTALALGEAWHAHVMGVFVRPRPTAAPLAIGPGAGVAYSSELDRIWRSSVEQVAEASRSAFDEAAARSAASAEWVATDGDPGLVLARFARYADVAVIGQSDPDRHDHDPDLASRVVMGAGRPVLVQPYVEMAPPPYGHVMVAWDGSREAAAALTGAGPFLAAADRVTVVTVNPEVGPEGHGELPGADIALTLARHGLDVTTSARYGEDIEVGDMLLGAVSDLSADLLVMGCYGTSRMVEMMLGGATRRILASMTCPVLMAH